MKPTFDKVAPVTVPHELGRLLPEQGSYELQNDQPGKLHSWHRHNLTEELLILSGQALLFWEADGHMYQKACPPGTWITLPAGVTHGSIAGPDGCVYMIRPEDGRAAETSFLDSVSAPHPVPTWNGR